MDSPNTYSPEQVVSLATAVQTQLPSGKWVACRPLGMFGLGLMIRIKAAVLVFTGRADVLIWEGQP